MLCTEKRISGTTLTVCTYARGIVNFCQSFERLVDHPSMKVPTLLTHVAPQTRPGAAHAATDILILIEYDYY